jgi:hypothetical protein
MRTMPIEWQRTERGSLTGLCPTCGRRLARAGWDEGADNRRYLTATLEPGFTAGTDGIWVRSHTAAQLYGNRGREVRRQKRFVIRAEYVKVRIDPAGRSVNAPEFWLLPSDGTVATVRCPGRDGGRRACGALVAVSYDGS